jgi:hypothetical protein
MAVSAVLGTCGCAASPPDAMTRAPASEATCQRLADHLVHLLAVDLEASGLPTTAADGRRPALLAECLDHGDALTASCLLSARALDETRRCDRLDPAREPEPLADAARPRAEDCARFASHAVALLRADLERRGLDPTAAEEAGPDLEATCMAEASRSQVECGLAAQTTAGLEDC